MSIATLKKKTNATHRNLSTNVPLFSLNGTRRNQGWVGQDSMSRKGIQPSNKNWGGCCGTFNDVKTNTCLFSLNDDSIVKSTVMNNAGMLKTKHKWLYRGGEYAPVKQQINESYIETLKNKNIKCIEDAKMLMLSNGGVYNYSRSFAINEISTVDEIINFDTLVHSDYIYLEKILVNIYCYNYGMNGDTFSIQLYVDTDSYLNNNEVSFSNDNYDYEIKINQYFPKNSFFKIYYVSINSINTLTVNLHYRLPITKCIVPGKEQITYYAGDYLSVQEKMENIHRSQSDYIENKVKKGCTDYSNTFKRNTCGLPIA